MRESHSFLRTWVLLSGLACATAPADPQLWRPASDPQADTIPGPLVNFGPYNDFSDALKAACPLILSKPNATVAHLQERDLALAKRLSKEYCAWLYFTPARKYELSMLTDAAAPGGTLQDQTTCNLPPRVDDPRYPPESIRHIFILHNHPFAGELSQPDIRFAMDMARMHALVAETGDKKVPLSIIAFFSNSKDGQTPSCDGFYQYVPATRELLQWDNPSGGWRKKSIGVVNWALDGTFSIVRTPTPARPRDLP